MFGVVRCALAVTFGLSCIAVRRPPEPSAETVPARQLRLLSAVLQHTRRWRPVLRQKVKITDEIHPAYHGGGVTVDPAIAAKLSLLDDSAVAPVAPLMIIQKVVREYAWLGSHLQFAVDVLRAAFACFTYASVSLLLESIMDADNASLDCAPQQLRVKKQFLVAWYVLAGLADKLSAVDDDLDALGDLSYAFAGATFADARVTFKDLEWLRAEIDRKIEIRCDEPRRDQMYVYLGIETNKRRWCSTSGAGSSACRAEFYELVDRLSAVYDDFNIATMPMGSWKQILNFKIPVRKGVKMT